MYYFPSRADNPGRPALFGPTISVYWIFIEGRMVLGSKSTFEKNKKRLKIGFEATYRI